MALCAGEGVVPSAESGASSRATAVDRPALYTAAERDGFLRRADELALHRETPWLTLLHVADAIGGQRSRVDDVRFFLAPDGKGDPAAELRADLLAFFAAVVPGTAHAAERFPGRLEWLAERLGLDRERLPMPRCAELEGALTTLAARQITLVFPAAYMGTPASLFGHTLITVQGAGSSALLSKAINYAAVTTETNGVLFAFKGIFGLYPGYYSMLPYYQKVQEYADLDQRDLWEYRLALDAGEIRRLLLHVWELRGIASRYFFFDENCSYNLLFLLDAARPGQRLSARTGGWVIPLDTVRLVADAGLVASVTCRPSRATRVRALAAALPGRLQEAAVGLARGTQAPATVAGEPPAQQAAVLDLAGEYLQALRGRQEVAQAAYQPRLHAILAARSALTAPPVTIPEDHARPDAGHRSGRLSLGGGVLAGQAFAELGVRPAYHELLDRADGYLPGAQVVFAEATLRWYSGDGVELERFEAIRLRSYAARDRFFQPIAWGFGTGFAREHAADGSDRAYGFLDGGAGGAWRLGADGLGYALLAADVRLGEFDHSHAIGAGPEIGAVLPITSRWRLHPHGRWIGYGLGDIGTAWEVGIDSRLDLAANAGLTLSWTYRDAWDEATTSISAGALVNF